MSRNRNRSYERIAGLRLTENPTLYGLVVREQGLLIEYVSFPEARRRHEATAKNEKMRSVSA